jgi:hypothetical protein
LEVFDGDNNITPIYTVLYHVPELRKIITSYQDVPAYQEIIEVFRTKMVNSSVSASTLLDTLINSVRRDESNLLLGSLINIQMTASDEGVMFQESLYLTDVDNLPRIDKSFKVWLIRSPLLFVMGDHHPLNAVYRCNLFNDLTIENYYNLLTKNQTLEDTYNPIAVCKTINDVVHLYLYHDNKIHLLRNGQWTILGGKNMNRYVKDVKFVLYERQTASQNNFIGDMIIPFRKMILKNDYHGSVVPEISVLFRMKDYSRPMEDKMPTLEGLTKIKLTSELVMLQNETIEYYRDIRRFHNFLINKWNKDFYSNLSTLMTKCNNILSYLNKVSIINDYKKNPKWLIDSYLPNEYKVIHDIPYVGANTPFQQERQMKIDFVNQLTNILMTIKLYHKNIFNDRDPVIIMLNRIHNNMLFIRQHFDYYTSQDITSLDSKLNNIISVIKSFSVYLGITNQLNFPTARDLITKISNKLNVLIKYTASKYRLFFDVKSKSDYQYLIKQQIQPTDIMPFIQPIYKTTDVRFEQNEQICILMKDQQLKIFCK